MPANTPSPAHPPRRPRPILVAKALACTLGAGLITPLTAQAVSPADRDRLEGSKTTSYPLGRFDCRYQQLYGDVPAQTIQGHAYRRDGLSSRTEVKPFRTEMEVSLSAVIQVPAKVSRTFADNVGARLSKVLDRTFISFPRTDRPTRPTAPFDLRIPYTRPYAWTGQGTLSVDMTIYANDTSTGQNKTFSADLDGHQTYASGRNAQPGYRFGKGCQASGFSTAAWCAFEVRHEGPRMDLAIDSRWGVPTTTAGTAESALILSLDQNAFPWPPGSGCTVYGTTAVVLPLPGDNDARGRWQGVVDVGMPAPPFFSLTGQIVSYARHSGETVLSDASELIAPPNGFGVVSSRVISASDHTSPTGTTSTIVPVTLFF